MSLNVSKCTGRRVDLRVVLNLTKCQLSEAAHTVSDQDQVLLALSLMLNVLVHVPTVNVVYKETFRQYRYTNQNIRL